MLCLGEGSSTTSHIPHESKCAWSAAKLGPKSKPPVDNRHIACVTDTINERADIDALKERSRNGTVYLCSRLGHKHHCRFVLMRAGTTWFFALDVLPWVRVEGTFNDRQSTRESQHTSAIISPSPAGLDHIPTSSVALASITDCSDRIPTS